LRREESPRNHRWPAVVLLHTTSTTRLARDHHV